MAKFACTVWLVVLASAWMALGDLEADEKECRDKLKGLTVCASFVSKVDKFPSKECCRRLVGVRAVSPKCLCILLIESSRPSAIGPPVNQTHALEMINLCKVQGKVSDCPVILNLPPDSPEARSFQTYGKSNASASPASVSAAGISSGSRLGVRLQVSAVVFTFFMLRAALNI